MRQYLCECLKCHNQQSYFFDEPFPTAGDDNALDAGRFYQSGVFDTGEYEPGYEMFPIYKDFRGFVSSRRSFWFMGIMKLSARTMYAYENAARLLGKSCSDMVYRVRI